MARYDYQCETCGVFEVEQSINDAPLEVCSCGSSIKRLISATSFSLKGRGWAKDGYKFTEKNGTSK